jgi:hypothetical protein
MSTKEDLDLLDDFNILAFASPLPFLSSPSLSTTFLQVPSRSSSRSFRQQGRNSSSLQLSRQTKKQQSLFNAFSIIIKK